MELIYFFLAISLLLLLFLLVLRLIKTFIDIPMPPIMADVIDNPLRRRIQPPAQMPLRHGIKEGMRVLEVGPGNGRHSVEAARKVGALGMVVAVDISYAMLSKTQHRAKRENITNLYTAQVDVHRLPFRNNACDSIYMIAVIGEIPQPEKAMVEFCRVVSPGGTLAFSELLPDPDYPPPKKLIHMVEAYGFRLINRLGNWFAYTLVFEKKETKHFPRLDQPN